MKSIDVPEALELLQAAVDERGAEMVYAKTPGALRGGGCYYWHAYPGAPGCIVGTGLYLKGYANAEMLRRMDDCPSGSTVADVVESEALEVSITEDAVTVLMSAQGKQDAHYTWGEALTWAREVAKVLEEK